jgi:tetratricopeptide (TPR) repeat protein
MIDRVQYAQLLVELGELHDAEREVLEVLEQVPDDLTALNLFAKIKHMRGELSQAVACWAQIHARSPHSERALMYLGSILQLTKDPERGASEYLALGPGQLVHKPTAHLELEGAFRAFLQRRPEEAYAACERLAHKYRIQDPMLYKLAVLAKAWIAELSGDLDVACTTLEELGEERGFETDTDRVLALARVYERLGTRDRLQKAAHIFRFLERNFGKISALWRLGRLYRRLDEKELAERYEKKYEIAFQRRMHRPSLEDVAAATAAHYVPLEMLARVRPVGSIGERTLDARERAIVAFLEGDRAQARTLFAGGEELLDRKYFAEITAMEGDYGAAARLFELVLDADARDRAVVRVLLGHAARSKSRELASVVRRSAARARILEELEAQLRAMPLRASTWETMATLRAILGDEAEAARCAERAAALRVAAERDSRPIGRVLAAAVFQFVGKTKGLIHQIWADRRPVEPGRGGFLASDDVLGNVTLEMKQSVRNTFFAVREYARSRFPQQTSGILDFNYSYKVTKEDEPSGGPSAGLPTSLAFLSVFLQRPVPQDVAFSGVLIADAHDALVVRSVGDAAYKVKGAYHRNLRGIVMPAENRADLSDHPQVPASVCDQIVRFVTTLDEAVTLTFGAEAWVT